MVGIRSRLTVILSALLVAGTMAVVAPPPAEAQTARKLKCNGCVKSKNMKRTIFLGRNGKVGNFGVRDTSGNTTVNLNGGSGDVTNSLSGNGLVKAWARLNANGTVISCFRCNTDPAETRKIPATTGIWEVDFTPLGTDISSRPRMCTSEKFSPVAASATDDNICNTSTSADLSTVNVRIWDGGQAANTPEDDQFTVIVF